jgi:hypothetical protein
MSASNLSFLRPAAARPKRLVKLESSLDMMSIPTKVPLRSAQSKIIADSQRIHATKRTKPRIQTLLAEPGRLVLVDV